MRVIEYTGDDRIEAPDSDELQKLSDDGNHRELIEQLVKWKGWVTVGDLCDNWGMRPSDVGDAVDELESEGIVDSWKEDEEDAIGFS